MISIIDTSVHSEDKLHNHETKWQLERSKKIVIFDHGLCRGPVTDWEISSYGANTHVYKVVVGNTHIQYIMYVVTTNI